MTHLSYSTHRTRVALLWRIESYNDLQKKRSKKIPRKVFMTALRLYNLYGEQEEKKNKSAVNNRTPSYQIDYSLGELSDRLNCTNQTIKVHLEKLQFSGMIKEVSRTRYQHHTAVLHPEITLFYPTDQYYKFYELCKERVKELEQLSLSLPQLFEHLN